MKKVILIGLACMSVAISSVYAQKSKANYLEISSGALCIPLGEFKNEAKTGANLEITYKDVSDRFGMFYSFRIQTHSPNIETMSNNIESNLGSSVSVTDLISDNYISIGITTGLIGNFSLSKSDFLQPRIGLTMFSCNSPFASAYIFENINYTSCTITQDESKALTLGFITGLSYIHKYKVLYYGFSIDYMAMSPKFTDVETIIEDSNSYDVSYSSFKTKNRTFNTQGIIGINF